MQLTQGRARLPALRILGFCNTTGPCLCPSLGLERNDECDSLHSCNEVVLMILLSLNTRCRMQAVGFRQGFRGQVQMPRMGFEVLLALALSQLLLSSAAL